MEEIVVSTPARPESVRVLRSVVAGVASQQDVSYDAIEDLRIAIDEACAYLLSGDGVATTLSMTIRPQKEAIEIEASSDASPRNWPPDGGHYEIMWQVLSAVTDEVHVDMPAGHPTIRFLKHLPAPT